MLDERSLCTLDGAVDDGLIDGGRGFATAAAFTHVKGYPEDKVVGVLLGKLQYSLFGADVFAEHHVCVSKFAAERASRRRSSVETPTQQDRLGMHTLRFGDHIAYNHLADGESHETAWVYCIVYKQKCNREQARKFVVVYEPSSAQFFLQSCKSWRRVSKTKGNLDPDDPSFECARATVAERAEMEPAWEESTKLDTLKKVSDAQNACKAPPPALAHQRRELDKNLKAEPRQAEKKRAKQDGLAAQLKKAAATTAATAAQQERDRRKMVTFGADTGGGEALRRGSARKVRGTSVTNRHTTGRD